SPLETDLSGFESQGRSRGNSFSPSQRGHFVSSHSVRQSYNSSSKEDDETNKQDRKSTRLNSSHVSISYAVFCLKKKKKSTKIKHQFKKPIRYTHIVIELAIGVMCYLIAFIVNTFELDYHYVLRHKSLPLVTMFL